MLEKAIYLNSGSSEKGTQFRQESKVFPPSTPMFTKNFGSSDGVLNSQENTDTCPPAPPSTPDFTASSASLNPMAPKRSMDPERARTTTSSNDDDFVEQPTRDDLAEILSRYSSLLFVSLSLSLLSSLSLSLSPFFFFFVVENKTKKQKNFAEC